MTPRKFILGALLPVVMLSSSGCTIPLYTSIAVKWYCSAPDAVRQANHILVNADTAPNAVAIYCAGGGAND